MTYDFGDVVVVPFPFVDHIAEKRRPALVLSTASFNASQGHAVLAMVTTAANSTWPTDIEIADIKSAGLKHASFVRWKLFTLPGELIIRRLGATGPSDRAAVAETARAVFGFFSPRR